MSNAAKSGAVIFAKDLTRVARFYQGIAALCVVHVEQDHVVLESKHMELVIHAIPQRIAEEIIIADPPELRAETPIKLFFPVASLDDARSKAPALGGALGAKSKEWEDRGFLACDGNDPEGNVVQFRENAR